MTTGIESTRVYLTVTAEMLDSASPDELDFQSGELRKVEKAKGDTP